MPNNDFLRKKQQESIEKLEVFLKTEYSQTPARLNQRRLEKYKPRDAIAGWALSPPGMRNRIIVFVDSRYPFTVPKTAIEAEFPEATYPHIESDGYLCLNELAVPRDENDIGAVAKWVISESITLLNKCFSGENKEDFKDEILAYWERKKTKGEPSSLSLLDLSLNKESRLIKIWRGIPFGSTQILFAADTEEEGLNWLKNKNNVSGILESEDAMLAWSDKVLLPEEYPTNNKQLCDLLKNHCGKKAFQNFQSLASKTPQKISVFLGFETNTGKALVCLEPHRPSKKRLQKGGFRLGKIPPSAAGEKYSTEETSCSRLSVTRVDASWVLSRDSDQNVSALKNKTVTLIGCGSIGSEVLRLLVQNGVQKFHLIDFDIMDWVNLGRHSLGSRAAYSKKVEALKYIIESDFPHAVVESIHYDKCENVLKKHPHIFLESDLVIMATGDLPASNALNQHALSYENFPPVIYAWSEAYAAAGHALGIMHKDSCFNCLFDQTEFKFKLTEFEQEKQAIPSCGGMFQPFSSIELSHINATTAALSIDFLVGQTTKSQLRSWIGSQRVLQENNGKWSNIAAQKIAARGIPTGQFMMQLDINKIVKCKICGGEEVECSSQMMQILTSVSKKKS